MIALARKPAMAPTTIQAMKPMGVFLPCWWLRSWSGRLPPEDADRPEHDELQDGPAHEGDDRGDVEDGARGVEGVRPENPVERRHEPLADGKDRGHEPVGL